MEKHGFDKWKNPVINVIPHTSAIFLFFGKVKSPQIVGFLLTQIFSSLDVHVSC